METFLIRALQLIMSLSLLIIIHEGGHFLFARLFKTRVEKFYLFFDPWFALFKFKPKKGETEYGIGWVPLGGYVKISGMIDESLDSEQMSQPPQPWEFRSKPAWQRLLIMTGGVLFNFLLALFIYSMILFTWGDTYIPLQKAPLGMEFNETGKAIGFRDGDILLEADNVPLERRDGEAISRIVDAREVTVLRDGEKVVIPIPEDMMERLMADSLSFMQYRIPYVIDSISPGAPAALAGLLPGDSITHLNGRVVSFFDVKRELENMRTERNAAKVAVSSENVLADTLSVPNSFMLTYVRAGETMQAEITPDTAKYVMGAYSKPLTEVLPFVKKEYTFLTSFPAGIDLGMRTLKGYVNNMKHLFSKQGAKQLGGFGTIASIFPITWDWYQFWYMTAFLSIILAFMNILPIPALDGGHVLFLIYEIVARRKPGDKFLERAQVAGMFFLFGLLLWANLNDIIRFFF